MRRVKVTHLEMLSPEQFRPRYADDPEFAVHEAKIPVFEFNRFLYTAVGRPWRWTDKLNWSDQDWKAYVEDPHLRTFAAYLSGSPAGYYELQKQEGGQVYLAYLGLMSFAIGRGLGAHLLSQAVADAWAWGASRVWLHTCTLDHPHALNNYQARGFQVFKVEE
jgi:GNAT superfamily N-acetyltransferase